MCQQLEMQGREAVIERSESEEEATQKGGVILRISRCGWSTIKKTQWIQAEQS